MGALGPNSHQMLLNSTPKCCKPHEINIRFLGISVTRLIGKGRSESMRPLTASFESLWLTSELLPMTLALLTIRMMTTNTSQVLQQQLNFPSWLTWNASCAKFTALLSAHTAPLIIKHHELSCTYYELQTKQFLVFWHFPTSWKAFRSAAINWSASCWTVPSQSKPNLNKNLLNDPGCQQCVKHSVTLKTEASELNYWMLEDPTWRIQNPHLVAPSASSSPRAPSVLEVPAGVATTAPAVAHHRGRLQSTKMHFELWLLGKALSNCGIDLSFKHVQTIITCVIIGELVKVKSFFPMKLDVMDSLCHARSRKLQAANAKRKWRSNHFGKGDQTPTAWSLAGQPFLVALTLCGHSVTLTTRKLPLPHFALRSTWQFQALSDWRRSEFFIIVFGLLRRWSRLSNIWQLETARRRATSASEASD